MTHNHDNELETTRAYEIPSCLAIHKVVYETTVYRQLDKYCQKSNYVYHLYKYLPVKCYLKPYSSHIMHGKLHDLTGYDMDTEMIGKSQSTTHLDH